MEAIEHPLIFKIPNFWPINWFAPGPYVPDHVTLTWLVMLFLAIVSYLATRSLQAVPAGVQNLMEVAVEELGNFVESVIGPRGRRYLWLLGGVALFIVCANLLGIVPGLSTPTSNWNTTLALALTIFVSYNVIGMKEHGVGPYLRHFCGPFPWLAPIMVPVELIGHLARPVSLSIRLFGNMFGEHTVTAILLSLWTLIIPYMIYLGLVLWLGLFVAVVQAFVFLMLSCVYIAGALEGGHEEGHGHGEAPHRASGSQATGRSPA